MKTIREGPVVIYPRDRGVIDVFVGKGWDQHTMFKVVRGVPHLVKGYDPLSEKDYDLLKELVNESR